MCMKYYLLASLIILSAPLANASEITLLQQVIDGDHRSVVHKNRDQYRHPVQTLTFFAIEASLSAKYWRRSECPTIA